MTRFSEPKKFRAYEKCVVVRETEKALLVNFPLAEGIHETWIAKSQIHDDSEVYEKGTEGKLVISEWLAKEKNIEEEGCAYEPR